jgi:hypothetical protein
MPPDTRRTQNCFLVSVASFLLDNSSAVWMGPSRKYTCFHVNSYRQMTGLKKYHFNN